MCRFHIWNNIFLMFKIKCEKRTLQLELAKWRKKTLYGYFFKCSFIKRVWSVIFKLNEVTLSNFVKFRFQRMTLKIERVFEEINNISSQNLAKRAMHLLTKKDHNKWKISYIRKKYILNKIISLYTINILCVVIEIYAT